MFLITSAAYISSGLASEFGKLPPSMLPVQNKRLYEHQVALVPKKELIVLSLPQSYKLTKYDEKRLSSLNIHIVFVPDGFSLGQSVIYVLNSVAKYSQSLSILHGDTLFSELTSKEDVCAVADAEDAYEWASVGEYEEQVYSGYFSFTDQSLLIKKITECSYNFMQGVEEYRKTKKISMIELPNWMDFGLLNSYYRSISRLTTQRVFNSMDMTRYSVRKSSSDKLKMMAEANWLSSLPISMKHYAPSVWDRGEQMDKGYYEIEYYFLSSLANLYVFGHNKAYVWKEIIDACVDYLNDEFLFKSDTPQKTAVENDQLYALKTNKRLKEYADQVGISLEHSWRINGVNTPSLKEIANITDALITKQDIRFATLMHGDPCFSNILYDFKSKSIKVIDPRGLDNEGNISIYGDFRYDVAKLAHSVLGMYDFIIGGMYEYKELSTYDVMLSFDMGRVIEKTQDYFRSKKFGGYSLSELGTYAILVHLFLSMLPLHSDHPERQKAMLANALRIYVEFIKM